MSNSDDCLRTVSNGITISHDQFIFILRQILFLIFNQMVSDWQLLLAVDFEIPQILLLCSIELLNIKLHKYMLQPLNIILYARTNMVFHNSILKRVFILRCCCKLDTYNLPSQIYRIRCCLIQRTILI